MVFVEVTIGSFCFYASQYFFIRDDGEGRIHEAAYLYHLRVKNYLLGFVNLTCLPYIFVDMSFSE
jgi:hypothetical protein